MEWSDSFSMENRRYRRFGVRPTKELTMQNRQNRQKAYMIYMFYMVKKRKGGKVQKASGRHS